MGKPRIFLRSSGKQTKLRQAVTRGLEDVAHVEPWTTSFNAGTTTLERLLELTRQVDFAAFVFAQDDWTTNEFAGSDRVDAWPGISARQRRLRGGPFRRRHRNAPNVHPARQRRQATNRPSWPHVRTLRRVDRRRRDESRLSEASRRDQERGPRHPYRRHVVAFLADAAHREGAFGRGSSEDLERDRNGALELNGRSWQEDGTLSARYWSEAVKEKEDSSGIFYYWKGERPLQPDAPQQEGTGEIRIESADRASGSFITRAEKVSTRTAGVFLRAEPTDMSVLDGHDDRARVELIAERLMRWRSIKST